MLYLLSLKVKYPDRIWLLRGNHECRTVSSHFGFLKEVEAKYGKLIKKQINEKVDDLSVSKRRERASRMKHCSYRQSYFFFVDSSLNAL